MNDWETPGPGPWQQDSAHAPVSGTMAVLELYPEGFNRGFTETFSRYGLLLDRLAMAVVNGFTYHQPQPFDMPGPNGPMTPEQIGAEIGRRAAVAEEAFATKQWRQDLDLWDNVCKPAAIGPPSRTGRRRPRELDRRRTDPTLEPGGRAPVGDGLPAPSLQRCGVAARG
jgi:hypothetical protein